MIAQRSEFFRWEKKRKKKKTEEEEKRDRHEKTPRPPVSGFLAPWRKEGRKAEVSSSSIFDRVLEGSAGRKGEQGGDITADLLLLPQAITEKKKKRRGKKGRARQPNVPRESRKKREETRLLRLLSKRPLGKRRRKGEPARISGFTRWEREKIHQNPSAFINPAGHEPAGGKKKKDRANTTNFAVMAAAIGKKKGKPSERISSLKPNVILERK